MSAMQRHKGAKFERELAAHLRAAGLDARRGIGQARSASEVPDVELDGWWIEAKRHQRTNPKAALAQADKAAAEHGGQRVPVAVCRDNGSAMPMTTVTLYLDDWIRLVLAARDLDTVCASAAEATAAEMAADVDEVLP